MRATDHAAAAGITQPGEAWLPIPGYEGLYEVSSLGRVYSRPRERTRGGLIKTPINKNGYPEVHLNGPNGRTWLLHAVVCLAFFGPRPDDLEVRHLDGNKANPTLPNLAYGTRSENVLDRVRHGTHNMASKTHCKRGHPLTAENVYVAPGGNRRQCRRCVRYCWAKRQGLVA